MPRHPPLLARSPLATLLLAAFLAFPQTAESTGSGLARATVDGEKLFGYAGIGSEEDLREVSHFSNVVLLSPAASNFESMVRLARSRNMRVALAWDAVLFDLSSKPYRLHTDFRQRFEQTVAAAPGLFRDLAFHQPVDEPYWNGVAEEEVQQALALMKEVFPGIPSLIVMAWPTLDTRTEPVPSDWVAFDLYFVANPVEDATYQFYWDRMRSLNPGKPIVVIADGYYSAGHALAGLSRDDMGTVLRAYQELFESEPNAVALGVFQWTDSPAVEGTRTLPESVLREHIAVGSEITGRCGIPMDQEPLAGESVLWFQDCRFYARVEVNDPRIPITTAMGTSLTEESGTFWFSRETNIEITLKLLDGVAFNGHFWVFLSDMTDLSYHLEIREVATGHSWNHSNLGGAVPIRRDITAFPIP